MPCMRTVTDVHELLEVRVGRASIISHDLDRRRPLPNALCHLLPHRPLVATLRLEVVLPRLQFRV